MKIIWLEDEPETIEIVRDKILEFCSNMKVCKSFSSFSDELEELEDNEEEIIIIDIRMIFNSEIQFTCFGKPFSIHQKLESGFEYYNNCLRDKFLKTKIIFFSSKPHLEAQKDAKKHEIETDLIISKDYTTELISKIKESI